MAPSARSPLWRQGDFMKLWAAQTVSDFGARITREGLPLAAVLTVRATPAQLGLLAALTLGPSLVVGLLAGGFVDRRRRRGLMIGADLARAAVLIIVPVGALFHWLSMDGLYVAAFVVGAVSVLFDIADHAYLPSLVDRALLIDANAKFSTTKSIAEMGGPALAGVLVQVLTAPVAIAINAATYLLSALFLAGIHHREASPQVVGRTSLWADLSAGLAALWAEPLVRPIFLSSIAGMLFLSFFQALYVLFAIRILGLSPAVLGVVIAMGGVGALAGSLIFQPLARAIGFGPATVISSVISTASALLIPFAGPSKALAVAMMVAAQLLGDSFGVAMLIGTKSLQQAVLPQAVLGRAGAAMRAASGAAAILGALAGGWLAGPFGVRQTLIFAVSGYLAAQAFLVFSPLFRLKAAPVTA